MTYSANEIYDMILKLRRYYRISHISENIKMKTHYLQKSNCSDEYNHLKNSLNSLKSKNQLRINGTLIDEQKIPELMTSLTGEINRIRLINNPDYTTLLPSLMVLKKLVLRTEYDDNNLKQSIDELADELTSIIEKSLHPSKTIALNHCKSMKEINSNRAVWHRYFEKDLMLKHFERFEKGIYKRMDDLKDLMDIKEYLGPFDEKKTAQFQIKFEETLNNFLKDGYQDIIQPHYAFERGFITYENESKNSLDVSEEKHEVQTNTIPDIVYSHSLQEFEHNLIKVHTNHSLTSNNTKKLIEQLMRNYKLCKFAEGLKFKSYIDQRHEVNNEYNQLKSLLTVLNVPTINKNQPLSNLNMTNKLALFEEQLNQLKRSSHINYQNTRPTLIILFNILTSPTPIDHETLDFIENRIIESKNFLRQHQSKRSLPYLEKLLCLTQNRKQHSSYYTNEKVDKFRTIYNQQSLIFQSRIDQLSRLLDSSPDRLHEELSTLLNEFRDPDKSAVIHPNYTYNHGFITEKIKQTNDMTSGLSLNIHIEHHFQNESKENTKPVKQIIPDSPIKNVERKILGELNPNTVTVTRRR